MKLYDSFLILVSKINDDPIRVFNDALDYALASLSIDQETGIEWHHSEQENEAFAAFYAQYLEFMQEKLMEVFWYDAWGDMYMDLAGKFKSFRGQFFTPSAVSNLCGRIAGAGDNAGRAVINDCACGSARMLLSANQSAYEHRQPQPYLIGEDIDGMCCKMAAINLAVHGCVGEVIRHDTLKDPDTMAYGYIINEMLPLGPSIRTSRNKSNFKKFRQ